MKKSQMSMQPIVIAMVVILAVFSLTYGLKIWNGLKEKGCQVELVKFKTDLGAEVELIDFDSVNEEKFLVPCNIDRVFFADLDKNIPPAAFNKYPEIKDSIKDKVKKNVFLIKDNKVKESFFIGELEFSYPYFLCTNTKGEWLSFLFERDRGGVNIKNECANDCTYNLVIPSDAAKIKEEASTIGESFGEANIVKEQADIYRRFDCEKERGLTKVEIIIIPKEDMENFIYVEYLPKNCIDNLNKYLQNVSPDYYKIKADPLIMWNFDSIEKGKEEVIRYVLNINLDDFCKEAIDGLAVAEVTVSDANNNPIITSTAITTATQNIRYKYPINAYDPNGDKLTYSLTRKPVGMTIDSNGKIEWLPTIGGSYDVVIEVSDNKGGYATQSFTIKVVSICTDECVAGQKECVDNSNFKECSDYNGDGCLDWNKIGNCAVGEVCQDGNCIAQTCTDGTPYGQCSSTKPLYCDNGNLINSCGAPYNCDCPAGNVCRGDGSCGLAQASLSISYARTRTEQVYDSGDNCYYNRCYYQTTVTNDGGADGIVSKRIKFYQGAPLTTTTYNQVVPAGQSITLPEDSAKSDCYIGYTYDTKYYDDSENVIGSIDSFTCNPP